MHYLVCAIIEQLQFDLSTAARAGQQAHDSATHSENIADNKYDTLAVEAAYLAHGQSMRIAQLQQFIGLYQHYQRPIFNNQSAVQVGALVCVENEQKQQSRLFIGPAAGGLSISSQWGPVKVITPTTPLARLLISKYVDDEVDSEINQRKVCFRIVSIE